MIRAIFSSLLLASTAWAATTRGWILDRNGEPIAATHLAGETGRDSYVGLQGRSGLQMKLNDALAKGRNVTTTLDGRVERAAKKVLADDGHPGGIVVLDAPSGEVLAMVSAPFHNPSMPPANEAPGGWRQDPRRPDIDRTSECPWKPDRELQVFEALSAASCGKLDVEEVVSCPMGGAVHAGAPREISEPAAKLNLRAAVQKANVHYFAQTAGRLTDRQYLESMRDFGFGQASGVGVPAESVGLMSPPLPRQPVTGAVNPGEGGVHFTSLQLARATCALATGGELPELHLVLLPNPAPKPTKSLQLPAPALKAVIEAMRASVDLPDGMAHAAAVEGMAVAGLSYTNEYVRTTGEKQETIRYGTFFGFAPAEKPKYVVVVTVEEGTGAGDAAACAGKVFRALP